MLSKNCIEKLKEIQDELWLCDFERSGEVRDIVNKIIQALVEHNAKG